MAKWQSSSQQAPLPVSTQASTNIATHMAQQLPANLGEYIAQNFKLLQQLGGRRFVKQHHPTSNFLSLNYILHPAKRLLFFTKTVAHQKFATPPWMWHKSKCSLNMGPHASCFKYMDFLQEVFVDMIMKGQWVALPASIMKNISRLHVSSPGVRHQHKMWPGGSTIIDGGI